jgi:hypothetical protein
MVWWPFAPKPERADTLEVTDLHNGAPPLYSTVSLPLSFDSIWLGYALSLCAEKKFEYGLETAKPSLTPIRPRLTRPVCLVSAVWIQSLDIDPLAESKFGSGLTAHGRW